MLKRFFSLFAVCALFLAAGCSSDDEKASTDDTDAAPTTETTEAPEEELTLDDWVEQADEICQDAEDAQDELGDPQSVEDIVEMLPAGTQTLEDQIGALEELGLPDEQADDVEAALDILNDQLEMLQQAADDIDAGDDPEEVLTAVAEAGEASDEELGQLAEDLGLEVCGAESVSEEPTPDPTTVETIGNSGDPYTYGDDADLDDLWDACDLGDPQACDDLWAEAPVDSEYESFGYSCGFRVPEGETAICSDLLTTSSGDPFAYGDDPTLDALWDACDGGDGQACDDLFFDSPFGSEYEAFGNTCGGRVDESEAGSTYCVDVM